MSDKDFEDNLGEVDMNYKPKPLTELKDKLPSFSQEKLCEIIVINRYFGSKEELALLCMEELANRRIAGEVFDFESYIEKSYNDMPKMEVNAPDISSVMRQLLANRISK